MSIYELVKVRGAPLQVRLGHGLELQRRSAAGRRSSRAAARRRPHVVPRGVRSRGGRHQERRHDAARRQDGVPRHGPPGDQDFINWKVREEKKAHALIAAGFSSDFNGEAYHTISGQNSNNSVRVTDEFMRAVEAGGKWQTRFRTTGEVCETFDAKDLWRQVADAAWAAPTRACSTTRPSTAGTRARTRGASTRRTRAPSTCSSTTRRATSRASTSPSSLRADGSFDVDGYRHACRVFFMAQEILVDLSSYPTRASRRTATTIARSGLGYANLGSLLMSLGVPYDSREGARSPRRSPPSCAATPTRRARRWPASKGPFPAYAKNREPMLRVMRMHRDAAYAIDRDACPHGRLYRRPLSSACEDWDDAVRSAKARVPQRAGHRARADGHHRPAHGLRHDRHRARLRAREVQEARRRRVLQDRQPDGAAALAPRLQRARGAGDRRLHLGHQHAARAPHINRRTLKEKGLTDAELAKVEARSPACSISRARSQRGSRRGCLRAPRRDEGGPRTSKGFRCSSIWASRASRSTKASDVIVGRMTIEGAPHLKHEHYAVFDCANRCGKTAQRFLAPMSHVRMMAAVQPFSERRHLEDGEPPERGDGRRRAGRPSTKRAGARPQGRRALPRRVQGKPAALDFRREEGGRGSRGSRTFPEPLLAPLPASAEPDQQLTLPMAPNTRIYGQRARLPKKRRGFTQEARVGGHKIFLRTGEYDDGTLGEIFIDMHKEGAAFRS
jgi:ribonucleoside-diphosphate reductase alpha chain